ncbi:AraC-type DNA-binding protein [Methylobacterium pseudosasicola]|uniref:AraC-type DNA-binding protein n=1 Tax=Methylobacterium pseudosasicola TaxID=582667 RepID=A0A1I4HGY3_9HYPH|nr:AraC-type DNA-binding protein [Methylobacterium pseudosasicola]
MSGVGFTRARSIGPVIQAVEASGGSVARVFRRAALPASLVDEPDRPVLLRDQFRLLTCAAREIGDDALPARLSVDSGLQGLGPLGLRVAAAPTLRHAIERAHALTPKLLQTATWTGLTVRGPLAQYGYAVTELIGIGRQENEILALGYLLGVVRHFMGPSWQPTRAIVTGGALPGRLTIEAVLGCPITLGPHAGLIFPVDILNAINPGPLSDLEPDEAAPIPDPIDWAACLTELLRAGEPSGPPKLDRLCDRLGLTRRTLQRRLEAQGTSFAKIRGQVLITRAEALLRTPGLPIGEIAYQLGYSDPAHFSRAFRQATGQSPRAAARTLP